MNTLAHKDFTLALNNQESRVVLIYNAVNHESLLGAVVMYRLLKHHRKGNLDLIDIRDAIYDDHDAYIWIDAGTPEAFRGYYGKTVTNAVDVASHRLWLERVMERSHYIQPQRVNEQEPEDTAVGQVIQRLQAMGYVGEREYKELMKLAVLSHKYHSDSLKDEEAVQYYGILKLACDIVSGRDAWMETLTMLTPPQPEDIERFKMEQSAINRRLSNKYRPVDVGGKVMHLITMSGYDVFGMIRRLTIAKRGFVHISMGSYGQVLYSDAPVPDSLLLERGVLNLTPPALSSKAV